MLRYGVIVGPMLRAWELDCVHHLEASGLAQLAVVVRHHGVRNEASAAAYDAFAEQSGARMLGQYGWLELARLTTAILTVDSDLDNERLKREVAAADPDFLLLLGPSALGEILRQSARLGVWSFAHGDLPRFESSVPGFWELYYGHDLTAGHLLKHGGGDDRIPLKSANLATVRRSFATNADAICSLMAKWPALVCRNVKDGVAEYLSGEPLPPPVERFGWPNVVQTAAVRARQAQKTVREYLRARLFSVDWNVGIIDGAPSDFIGKDARPRARYLFKGNPYDYIADPCILGRGSRTFLFCERYDHRLCRGFLVQTELVDGRAAPLQSGIAEAHHLSYPHVFEHRGEIYCIPESRAVRKVCLYRCIELPNRWEYVSTLIDDFDGADSTVISYGGKWWLFCTSSELVERGFNSHLYVWYADDLLGPWKPHVRNPVKMDARSARPAGPAFVHGNALYRPAQDCSEGYGGCIHLARVDVLTERDFQETLVGTIRAPIGAYSLGVHTISAANGVCVVDARRYVLSPWRFGVALRRLGRRLGLNRSAGRIVQYAFQRSRGPAATEPTAPHRDRASVR